MNWNSIAGILLCFVAAVNALDRNNKKYKVVCYLGSWANYRPGDGKFTIEDIDTNLCTHVIYGFAKMANNKITSYDTYLDLKDNYGLNSYGRLKALKDKNPNLTTLIAIGGWNEGSTKYSAMAADPAARATFVQSVIDFCAQYSFDGLDVDWEYPANRGGAAADKQNFVTLLKELKEALNPHGLLLSAAVAAGIGTIETAYDIPGMSKYLDFINVMAYDFHGSYDHKLGHNAPLYSRPEESEAEKVLNVDYAINYWIKKGAPSKKLILGMGTYGRSFTLPDPSITDLGTPSSNPGAAGPFTQEPGMLGYNEICLNLKNGWKEVFVPKVEAPIAFSGNQWVGYDNVKSIGIKVDYLMKKNLGGGMIWSLETDDFRGKCGEGKFPLLSQISNKLNGEGAKTPKCNAKLLDKPNRPPHCKETTTQQDIRPTVPTMTPQRPPIRPTQQPGEGFQCPTDGYFRDPNDCSVFYRCVTMGDDMNKFQFNCGPTAAFDENISTCMPRDKVPGC